MTESQDKLAQDQLARIGAAIGHAERLQKQAEATHSRIEAQTLALQKSAAQLLVGVDERSKSFGSQEQRLAAQIGAFTKQVELIGSYASAGGKAAVAEEVRAALKDAASVIGEAAKETTAPARDTLTASLAAIEGARDSLMRAQQRFSWTALAVIGAMALGALVLAGVGGFAMIGWQRAEIVSAKEELAAVQSRLQEVKATVAAMEDKGRALDARGVRFITDTCLDDKRKKRLCVEIDKEAPPLSSPDKTREFRVPKGF